MSQAGDLIREMERLSRLLDKGVKALNDAAHEYAEAESDYRRAKSAAWFSAPDGDTVRAKEAHVDAVCEVERRRRLLAEGLRLAALEAVRSRRQQMSCLQTVANASKAEAEIANYNQGGG